MGVKNSMILAFFCALLLIVSPGEATASKDVVNVNLHQVLELSGSVVRSQTTVHVENRGSGPLTEYSVILGTKESAKQLVYAEFAQKAQVKGTPATLKASQTDAEFKLTLGSPLKPGDKTYLIIKSVYHGPLQPFPREVEQNQAQALEFLGNLYFYSPYASLKQKTTVKYAVRVVYSSMHSHTRVDSLTLRNH
jgi:oligosaccharyltransferase complex subunit alpha (ribophorin I)